MRGPVYKKRALRRRTRGLRSSGSQQGKAAARASLLHAVMQNSRRADFVANQQRVSKRPVCEQLLDTAAAIGCAALKLRV